MTELVVNFGNVVGAHLGSNSQFIRIILSAIILWVQLLIIVQRDVRRYSYNVLQYNVSMHPSFIKYAQRLYFKVLVFLNVSHICVLLVTGLRFSSLLHLWNKRKNKFSVSRRVTGNECLLFTIMHREWVFILWRIVTYSYYACIFNLLPSSVNNSQRTIVFFHSEMFQVNVFRIV